MKILFLLLVFLPNLLFAQDDLEEKLESLRIPSWQMPDIISEEKIYSVQTRHNDLQKKHEFILGDQPKLSVTGIWPVHDWVWVISTTLIQGGQCGPTSSRFSMNLMMQASGFLIRRHCSLTRIMQKNPLMFRPLIIFSTENFG